MPPEVTLCLERPAGFESLTDAEWRAKLMDAVGLEEERARAKRVARGGRVLGRKAILRAVPMDRPKTVEPRRKLRPCIACLDRSRRIEELERLLAFRGERRAALLRLMAAEPDVVFPHGTYRIRGVFVVASPVQTRAPAARALSA